LERSGHRVTALEGLVVDIHEVHDAVEAARVAMPFTFHSGRVRLQVGEGPHVPLAIVGIMRDGRVEAAWLSVDGNVVTPIAELRSFWSDPQRWIAQPLNAARSQPVSSTTLVPPVLPDASVLCVGLN
jgi:hypothetical protein